MTGRRGRGRPRKSAADRNDQRRRIVESARTTIGAHGPSTSIGDIAAAAGVSKPLIYETFGDKAGLADAIAADLVAELIDDMHESRDRQHGIRSDTRLQQQKAVHWTATARRKYQTQNSADSQTDQEKEQQDTESK